MALQSASKAPRQLGYLCSHSWSRACGGHSAVYTAAAELQVMCGILLILSVLACGLQSCICLQLLVVLYGLGLADRTCMSVSQSDVPGLLSWHLFDACRLPMSHFSSLPTQPSCGLTSQIKHAGRKTSNLRQVLLMQQSVMRNSQQSPASSKALMILRLHSAPSPQGSWSSPWLSLGPAPYSPLSRTQMYC